jgi:hypothetical protein
MADTIFLRECLIECTGGRNGFDLLLVCSSYLGAKTRSCCLVWVVKNPANKVFLYYILGAARSLARSGVPHAGKSGRTLGTFCTES